MSSLCAIRVLPVRRCAVLCVCPVPQCFDPPRLVFLCRTMSLLESGALCATGPTLGVRRIAVHWTASCNIRCGVCSLKDVVFSGWLGR